MYMSYLGDEIPTSSYTSSTPMRCISSRPCSTVSTYTLIFSKTVHVYVLLGDELHDCHSSVALVTRPRDALVLDLVRPLVPNMYMSYLEMSYMIDTHQLH